MLIYFEGIDRAGKTTLIKNLNSVTNIPIYRKQPPSILTVDEHHSFFKGVGYGLVELHNLFNFDVLVDRSFISDWVYTNRKFRKKAQAIWLEWEKRQLKADVIILYLSISYNIFVERITNEPDPYMQLKDYQRFTTLYEEYLQMTSLPFVRIAGDILFEFQLKQILDWATDTQWPQGQRMIDILKSSYQHEDPNDE